MVQFDQLPTLARVFQYSHGVQNDLTVQDIQMVQPKLKSDATDREIQDFIVSLLQAALEDPLVSKIIETAVEQPGLILGAIATSDEGGKNNVESGQIVQVQAFMGFEWMLVNAFDDCDPAFGELSPALQQFSQAKLAIGQLPILVWFQCDGPPGGQALSVDKSQMLSQFHSTPPTIDVIAK